MDKSVTKLWKSCAEAVQAAVFYVLGRAIKACQGNCSLRHTWLRFMDRQYGHCNEISNRPGNTRERPVRPVPHGRSVVPARLFPSGLGMFADMQQKIPDAMAFISQRSHVRDRKDRDRLTNMAWTTKPRVVDRLDPAITQDRGERGFGFLMQAWPD